VKVVPKRGHAVPAGAVGVQADDAEPRLLAQFRKLGDPEQRERLVQMVKAYARNVTAAAPATRTRRGPLKKGAPPVAQRISGKRATRP